MYIYFYFLKKKRKLEVYDYPVTSMMSYKDKGIYLPI